MSIPPGRLSQRDSASAGRSSPPRRVACLRNPVLLLATVSVRERMGSGGLRGLQILRSGASGVRGGFDSHAFPPLLCGAALVALLVLPSHRSALAGPLADWLAEEAQAPACATWLARDPLALAQTDPAAPAKPPGGSLPEGIRVVGPGSQARSDSARRRPWHEQPRYVMARSLLVPGWGQAHNKKWVKAGLVAGVETWLAVNLYRDQKDLDRLLAEFNTALADTLDDREDELAVEYNAVLDQRTGRQWLLGLTLAYALADAYVDAHFRNFDIEFKNDPALPGGRPPESPSGGAGRLPRAVLPGVRLAFRWDF